MPIGNDNDANMRMILLLGLTEQIFCHRQECEEKAETYSAKRGSRHEFQARLRLHIVKPASGPYQSHSCSKGVVNFTLVKFATAVIQFTAPHFPGCDSSQGN